MLSRHGIPVGRIFGISIDLDYSWFLIVGLLTWMLAVSFYPAEFSGWTTGEYWAMGFVTAAMLFVSVLIHELAHSLMAQRYGIPVPRITLFLFGGVSQIAAEPPSAGQEFWISIVGPVTSLALAAFFWEIEPLVAGWQPLFALAEYLAQLEPDSCSLQSHSRFPAGRGTHSSRLVWRITGNFHRATIAAGVTGRFFGFLLIFLGVWRALTGDIVGGIWVAFIGWFLESAAGSQLQQEGLKNLLGGHRVMDAMRRDFPQVTGETPLRKWCDRAILPSGARYAIVTSAERPGRNGDTGGHSRTCRTRRGRPQWQPRRWFPFKGWLPPSPTRCFGRLSKRWGATGSTSSRFWMGMGWSGSFREKTSCITSARYG